MIPMPQMSILMNNTKIPQVQTTLNFHVNMTELTAQIYSMDMEEPMWNK